MFDIVLQFSLFLFCTVIDDAATVALEGEQLAWRCHGLLVFLIFMLS